MIEKFTAEELATIIDELTNNGGYALDKNAAASVPIMVINSAFAGMYGNKYSGSNKHQVKSAVYALADWATGNVKKDHRYGIERKRAVCVNPQKYRAAVEKIAEAVTSIAAESDYKAEQQEKEAAPERENGGLVYNALIAKLEAQKGENDA